MRFLVVLLVATAQHYHRPQDAGIHERFYMTWLRPNHRMTNGQRSASCCNLQDCHPTEFKHSNGHWWAKTNDGRNIIFVPEDILEHNQPDARESPDGRSHICVRANQVVCAVLGSAG